MTGATLYGLSAAGLVGFGLYGVIVHREALRRIIAFDIMGAGVFLLCGVVARRGAADGFPRDPVPEALVITGLVVALAATALAVTLLIRLHELTGSTTIEPAADDRHTG